MLIEEKWKKVSPLYNVTLLNFFIALWEHARNLNYFFAGLLTNPSVPSIYTTRFSILWFVPTGIYDVLNIKKILIIVINNILNTYFFKDF